MIDENSSDTTLCLFVLMLKRSSHKFFSHVGTEPPLPGYYQYFSESKCVFAQEHNTAEVGIEPRPLAPEPETDKGKMVSPIFLCCSELVFFILSRNEDFYERLNEFEC